MYSYAKYLFHNKYLFIIVLLIIFLTQSESASDKTTKACGEALYQAAKKLCVNGFNSKYFGAPIRHVRYAGQAQMFLPKDIFSSHLHKIRRRQAIPNLGIIRKMQSIWQRRPQKMQLRIRRRVRRDNYDAFDPYERIRQGIVDECCTSGCPYSVLKKYCADLGDAEDD